ncbi:hypothetical protein [Streptomyces microflavus]|uniref:hypothetical protein n=1 Tax=Streptomyces microflavus TaxID=1919 RepID=UPI002E33F4A2|nr:hypothetical protein [Streptomyces microflavus]
MAGPFQTIPMNDGASANLYLLRYGKDGLLRSPAAEADVKKSLDGVTDVYVFAHGWNNIFAAALDRYRDFATGFIGQRAQFAVPAPGPGPYRPLLVGVMWPSTSFVMPWEQGPVIAGPSGPDSPASAEQEESLELVTSEMNADEDRVLVDAVDGRTAVDGPTAAKLAAILLRNLRATADPDDGSEPPDVEGLLSIWSELDGRPLPERPEGTGSFGRVGSGGASAPPDAAGLSFDPRDILRVASVWKMKARSGVVGAKGVAPLLEYILRSESAVRLHLIGHSFGARVVLSALDAAVVGRPAHSMLLLQPAVNRWCLASKVEGTGQPGGYHSVLSPAKLTQPVLTTFSDRDEPLTNIFHLAMRGKHYGEQPETAAVGDTHRYGALGGYPPLGLDGQTTTCTAVAPGEGRYPLGAPTRVIAIDGGAEVKGEVPIPGHSGISNGFTWWALHDLTRGS